MPSKKIKLHLNKRNVYAELFDELNLTIEAGIRKWDKYNDALSLSDEQISSLAESILNYVKNDICEKVDWDNSE